MICISKMKNGYSTSHNHTTDVTINLKTYWLTNGHKHNFERTTEDVRAHTNHFGRWFKTFSIRMIDFGLFYILYACGSLDRTIFEAPRRFRTGVLVKMNAICLHNDLEKAVRCFKKCELGFEKISEYPPITASNLLA